MKNILYSFIAGLAAFGIGVALCGCETQSATQAEIVVTPSSATLSAGESADFTASGWDGYRWSLADNNLGVLSRTTGATVTYTCLGSASSSTGTVSVQTITVTGQGTGGAATTNGQSFSVSGYAIVRQI